MIETEAERGRRIVAEPDNDELRLVYADHLEEAGESERAELIRVEIELPAVLRGRRGPESFGRDFELGDVRRIELHLDANELSSFDADSAAVFDNGANHVSRAQPDYDLVSNAEWSFLL